VDEISQPTAEAVLDKLKSLDTLSTQETQGDA
jgi:hypothetical protein